ncbi:hypothetical protein D3C80_839860 [compost metagenome]
MAVVCSGALFGERPDAQHGRRVDAVGIHHGRDPLQGGEQQSLFPVLQGLEALDEALLQRGGGLGEQGATRVSQCRMHLALVGFAADALHQLAALEPVHDGGRGGLAHVGVIGQLAHGDLPQLVDPLEQQELRRGQPGFLDQAFGVHVDGTDDLAQSNQHFIMFFHGVGVIAGQWRGAKFSA